jgi:hypothetical protein
VRDILDDLSLAKGEPVYFSFAMPVMPQTREMGKYFTCGGHFSLCLMGYSASYLTFMKTVMKLQMAYIKL